MKPRQEPVEHTEEDKAIWGLVCNSIDPHPFTCPMLRQARLADRRDAALMYTIEAVRHRARGSGPPTYPNWPTVMVIMRGAAAAGEPFP